MSEVQTQNETTQEVETEGAIEQVVGTFGLRGDIFIAQLVNFIIVMLVMWRFVYKPVMRMLDEREKRIARSVKEAEEITKRLKQVDDERVEILHTSRVEAQALIEKAVNETEERKHEMIEAAKREVERVIVRGKEQMSTERDAMLLELRKDIIDIAVRAAAKIALEKVDEKKSQSLAEEVVRKLT
ncbi:MAG: F0F1 ATP synthase subunit B [Candidatus Uhrbacteria bacterium]|nr:F0F1 ATP synthase subunit B [Candidatus Uhrbacteria bacterium]